jgi:hypothetical protein
LIIEVKIGTALEKSDNQNPLDKDALRSQQIKNSSLDKHNLLEDMREVPESKGIEHIGKAMGVEDMLLYHVEIHVDFEINHSFLPMDMVTFSLWRNPKLLDTIEDLMTDECGGQIREFYPKEFTNFVAAVYAKLNLNLKPTEDAKWALMT